jgi:hypothetical protein
MMRLNYVDSVEESRCKEASEFRELESNVYSFMANNTTTVCYDLSKSEMVNEVR